MALRILSRSLVLRLTITLISLLISNYPHVKYETNLIKTYGLFFFNVLNCLYLIRNFYIYVTPSVTCPVVLTGCGIRVGFFCLFVFWLIIYHFVFYFLLTTICSIICLLGCCVCYSRSLCFSRFMHLPFFLFPHLSSSHT